MQVEMNWEIVGQFIGIVVLAFGGFMAVVKGYRKSTGAPPPERPPDQHELREALRELRDVIRRNQSMNSDDSRDILRVLDRVDSKLGTVEGQLGRIEASQRLTEEMRRRE